MIEARAVAVFGSSEVEPASQLWVDAENVGARLAEAGLTVITGGYGGTMEAASRGASMAGGQVIGVTAPDLFPDRTGANPYLTHEIETPGLTSRLEALTSRASGAVVLPGSIGTAAELILAWNLNHISAGTHRARLPTVAVGDGWRALWEVLTARLGGSSTDVHLAVSASDAVDWLLAQPEIR